MVGGAPALTVALAEAVNAFRRAWSRARGTRPARDLAAVAAVLRRGLTGAQALRVWQEAQPDALEPAPGYMRAILRQARDLLRRKPDRPSRSSAPPGP